MCGIAAVFRHKSSAPPVDRAELLKIRDHMANRGPDGAGEWFSSDGRIGLGHRRLSIIDLSPAGAQPMWSADGAVAIIFNGEIYNYRELRAELEANGSRFQSASDTEVLLHLYRAQRERMLDRLRGMYAFAIWDQREGRLFIARDPFGIKPLYYSNVGGTFRVASQVKALLAGAALTTTPDPAGHVGFFLWGSVPEPYTLHREIRALPAGSWMSIDADGNVETRSFCRVQEILANGQRAEAVTSQPELPSALADTVAKHLIADVPVGVFLSSGLDSATIAALAAQSGGELRTITLGFEEFRGTANDETRLAEQVAHHYRAQHQTVWISKEDFDSQLDSLLGAMDQPSIDGVNTYFVSLAAARAGLKVALSGLGGDEAFGGYSTFREIPRMVRALGLLATMPKIGSALRAISAPVVSRWTSPKYASLFEYGGTYAGAYLLHRAMLLPWQLGEVLDPEIVRAGWNELQPIARLEQTIAGLPAARQKISALEMCWYMRNQLLRDADWAGMAHSVEIRVPFVDTALLRATAPRLASANPPAKRDMADAPAKKLPPGILERPKTGFSIPVRDWLRRDRSSSAARGLRGWAGEVYQQALQYC